MAVSQNYKILLAEFTWKEKNSNVDSISFAASKKAKASVRSKRTY